jgi:hypothetical protein
LGPALKASVICLVIVVFCVGYVWEEKQIRDLSQQISNLGNQFASLKDKNMKLRQQYEGLRSPVTLDARVHELKLGLVAPQPSQIWRLSEPVPDKIVTNPPQPGAVRDTAWSETP